MAPAAGETVDDLAEPCSWLVIVACGYPGYLSYDSSDRLYQSRVGVIESWHPPIMAAYWRIFKIFVTGPFGVLLVQTRCSRGPCAVLAALLAARRRGENCRARAVLPVLTSMVVAWKDAQMAGFLLAGFALTLRSDAARGSPAARCSWSVARSASVIEPSSTREVTWCRAAACSGASDRSGSC